MNGASMPVLVCDPITHFFSLPLLSTPPCSPHSVLEPDCGPTLPGLCPWPSVRRPSTSFRAGFAALSVSLSQ